MSQAEGIGTFGSVALLVSSMTGPGLASIPALFQQAGWVAPLFVFCIIAMFSACAALFICEALSSIEGNSRFQAKVEFTTVAQLMLGKRYHYFFQLVLFIALQAVNVASIILASQTLDGMIITLFKGTCGLGIAPGGWFCTDGQYSEGNSPFSSDDYFIFTFGYLLTAVMVIPLGFFSLVENNIVQMTSFVVILGVLLQWIVAFCQEGLEPDLLPAGGPNPTMVLGIAIFNFSYITTIPTWVNSIKSGVSVHRCLGMAASISLVIYLMVGIFGAMAFPMTASSSITTVLASRDMVANKVTTYIFPICALVTSIPVFTIVIRSNLVRGGICSPTAAMFLSNLLPWLVCIPLMTKDYIGTIQNWSSLFFQSAINYILPFILYFASRRVPTEPEKEEGSVIMHIPEEDRLVTVRRSNIEFPRSSRITQVGHSNFGRSHLTMSPRSPRPYEFTPAPPIILERPPESLLQIPASSPRGSPNIHGSPQVSSTPSANAGIESLSPRLHMPGSPTTAVPLQSSGHIRPPSESAPRNHHFLSSPAQGLGITPSTPTANDEPNSRATSYIQSHSHLSLRNSNIQSAINHLPDVVEVESFLEKAQTIHEEIVTSNFKAFEPRPWLNPFYLAIISCLVLSVAVVFMIIYSVALLAMGNDILG